MPICPLAFRTGPSSTPLGTDILEFLQNLPKYKHTSVKFDLNSLKMLIMCFLFSVLKKAYHYHHNVLKHKLKITTNLIISYFLKQ